MSTCDECFRLAIEHWDAGEVARQYGRHDDAREFTITGNMRNNQSLFYGRCEHERRPVAPVADNPALDAMIGALQARP